MSMTVAELIDLLRSYPPALRIVVDGYEEGYDDLSSERISVRRIRLDAGTESWQGAHCDLKFGPERDSDAAETAEALVFRRASWWHGLRRKS